MDGGGEDVLFVYSCTMRKVQMGASRDKRPRYRMLAWKYSKVAETIVREEAVEGDAERRREDEVQKLKW
jgi:hypothetical protein